MKPFNLEAAQRGDKLVTRAGEEAEFIAYVPKAGEHYQVLALVGLMPKTYDTNGCFLRGSESTYDLFMAPKKRTIWLNIYPSSNAYCYRSEEMAESVACDERIGGKAWPLEIEE
jgi:hypothetical protein